MNPYIILGIEVDATTDQIKQAYKDKAKSSHPDKKGGSSEAFIEVNECYLILTTPNRRSKFDETGSTEPEMNFDKEFASFISSVFMPMINSNDIDHSDLIGELRKHVRHSEANFGKSILAEEANLKRLHNVKSRLKTKGNPIIHNVIDTQINQCNMNIISMHENIGFLHRGISVLEEYNYEVDKQEYEERWITISLNNTSL